jgi:hypothetical protein
MNCIAGSVLATCLLACAACGAPAAEKTDPKPDLAYELHYTVTPDPGQRRVAVSLQLSQTRGQLRELSFSTSNIDSGTIDASGEWRLDKDRIIWQPGRLGGTLSWQTSVDHRRNANGFDARLDDTWALFRAEDIIPRAATRTLRSAVSTSTLSFDLPPDWSAITEYKNDSGTFHIDNASRRFDQPTGWIVLGQLGVRRETIAGVRITIAAPRGHSVRRMDMLALLNWTLPELGAFLAELPPRLTIVSANDPMWRGGLSAPASIYIHASRPLISENATSTLLHEVMHVALRIDAADGYDWIVEGLAEYYTLELLFRGGAITARRYKAAFSEQAEWAKQARTLCASKSTAAVTALAVTRFRLLDDEIRAATNGDFGLDELTEKLSAVDARVDLTKLVALAEGLLGKASDVLHIDKLPGCRIIASNSET